MIFLQESEKELGCTTPFHPDKSNICIEGNKKLKAQSIFNAMLYNQTKAKKICMKPRVGPFGKSCQHRSASLTLAVDSPPEHFEPNWRSVGACAILRQASKVLAS